MRELVALKRVARERRDRAIDHARDEYERAMVQIATLERTLFGTKSRTRKLGAFISSIIPRDTEFTPVGIVMILQTLEPGRTWYKCVVNRHLATMRKKGLIERIRESRNSAPAVYRWAGVAIQPSQIVGMTLAEAVEVVLGDRQMTAVELTVAVLEHGYLTAMSRHRLREKIGMVLRKNPSWFRRVGGKWVTTQT